MQKKKNKKTHIIKDNQGCGQQLNKKCLCMFSMQGAPMRVELACSLILYE